MSHNLSLSDHRPRLDEEKRDCDRPAAQARTDHWEPYVVLDASLLRPSDGSQLLGDAGKARSVLGWRSSLGFQELIVPMTEHDLRLEKDPGVER